MASDRAKYSVDCSPSTVCCTRQRSIKGVKLGAASAARTARMATTTISSMAVKPRGAGGRRQQRAMGGLSMPGMLEGRAGPRMGRKTSGGPAVTNGYTGDLARRAG